MGVARPQNNEMRGLEGFLDVTFKDFEGSSAFAELEGIYEELDSELSMVIQERDDLAEQVEELQKRIDELESDLD